MGLDQAKQPLYPWKKTFFAEMGLGQDEQHMPWPPVYSPFFVCLALVVVVVVIKRCRSALLSLRSL
jgi:hypothetical protein